MNIEEKINSELKESIKSGNKLKMETLRSIRAAIIEFNKSGIGRELNDEDCLKIIQNQAKRRRDAIEVYKTANRPELLEKEEKELEIISDFLPQQLSEEQIRNIILVIIDKSGASGMQDIGKVMGPAMKELRGKADGGLVQTIVKTLLGSN